MEEAGFILTNGRMQSDCSANYTHISNQGNSVIDLVWYNLEMANSVLDLKSAEIQTFSDHFPCVLALNIPLSTSSNKTCNNPNNLKWFNHQKLNFYSHMAWSPNVALVSENIEDMHENIILTIKETAKSFGMFCQYSTPNKPWLDKQCKEEKHELKLLLNSCKKSSFSTENVIEYNEKKNFVKRLLEKKRHDYLDKKLNSVAQAKNPEIFWQAIKTFRVNHCREDAIPLLTWEKFYKEIFPPRNNLPLTLHNIVVEELDHDICMEELNSSLIKCKLKKSPDFNSLSIL